MDEPPGEPADHDAQLPTENQAEVVEELATGTTRGTIKDRIKQPATALVRRALLIGIDYYKMGKDGRNRNLKGCINDVLAVEKLLTDMGVPKPNITKLLSGQRRMGPLPTRRAIVHELEKIRDSDKSVKVDLLYIHYSGHGIPLKGAPSDVPGDDERMWTALAAYDTFHSERYLSGRRLGALIKGIIEKKRARVCLVLDTCFSGGGFREDRPPTFQPRVVEQSKDELELESDADQIDEEPGDNIPASRDVKEASNWIIYPVKCSVLTACGGDEIAGEDMLEGTKQGILTHFLCKILRQYGTSGTSVIPDLMPSYGRLKHEVCRAIQEMKTTGTQVRQTPTAHGELDFRFFGETLSFQTPFCEVVEIQGTNEKHVWINEGSSQGVAPGAIYSIRSNRRATPAMSIRITTVYPFCSEGQLQNPAGPKPTPGDIGFLQKWALRQEILVCLDIRKPSAQYQLKREIEKTPNLKCTTKKGKPFDFLVSIDTQGIYEVYHHYEEKIRRVPRVPVVSQSDHDAVPKIAHVLRHLARYKAVEGLLQIPCSPVHLEKGKFTIHCLELNSRKSLSKDANRGYYNAIADTPFKLELRYNGAPCPPFWVALFELNASWGIRKIFPDYGENAIKLQGIECITGGNSNGFEASVPPLKITTSIPRKCRDDDPPDILDQFLLFYCVFEAGHGAPSWDGISLPSLPVDGSLLKVGDFAIKTKRSDTAARATAEKIVCYPKSRTWNVLKFRVRSIAPTSGNVG